MMLKRILPLILVALMIISLSSCSNPKFEHPISISKLTDGDLKAVMLDYENDLMLELLNKGKWVDDIPNCGYDYEFEFGAHNVLRYHSECGTFIDTENSRSLTVIEQDKNQINESLNRSIKLPLGNEELLNLFSAALNEKGLRFGMFESEMLDFVDSLTFDGKPVNECYFAPAAAFFDGASVYGIDAYGDRGLAYGCKWQESSDVTTVSNNFSTELAIDGLPLPQGIKVGDDINKVLSTILGYQFNYQTGFVADEDISTDMTLARSDGNSSYLIFHDFRRSTVPAEYYYPLSIEFVELNCVYDGEKLTKRQSRSIIIFFDFPMIDKEVPTISKVEFSVIDKAFK